MFKEMKRALKNKYMAGAVLAVVLILGRAYIEFCPGMKKSNMLYIITLPMALSGFTPFAAVFPVIPFAMSFVEEYNSGYIHFAMVRQTRNKYILSKIVATAISGGTLMVIAFGLIFLVAIILGTPVDNYEISGFYENSIWESILNIWGGKLVLLVKLVLAFLFGAVWSLAYVVISTVFLNKYVAFMGIFVIYQTLWQLLQGSIFNPVYLLRADNTNYTSFWMPFVIQTGYLLMTVMLSVVLMRRRLRSV